MFLGGADGYLPGSAARRPARRKKKKKKQLSVAWRCGGRCGEMASAAAEGMPCGGGGDEREDLLSCCCCCCYLVHMMTLPAQAAASGWNCS